MAKLLTGIGFKGDRRKMSEGAKEEKKNGWKKAAKVSLGVLGGLSVLMGYISAAGMKESEIETSARKPIEDFLAALNARDVESIRRTLHYPHVQITGNEISVLKEPESFHIDFQSLTDEGWTNSTLDSCAMRQSCNEKVHFEIQLSMHKAKDSRYAIFHSLWIVTRIEGEWGIQCRSSFPSSVQPSLTLGRFPENRINKATRDGHRIAHTGR